MALSDIFIETFGRAPEGAWAAPGRVNLIGEYTDLNDGFVLPFAIPQVTSVLAARRSDRTLGMRSLQEGDGAYQEVSLDATTRPKGWAAYPVAVARSLELYGFRLGGADLLISSEVPVGAGLSSSAALECAVAMALCALFGTELPSMATALIAQRAENEFVGVPSGIMDQAASMCCTLGNALLLDTRRLEVQQVPFDPASAGCKVVVVDTRVKHGLATSAYGERRNECHEAARLLGVSALRDVPLAETHEALERLRQAGKPVLVRRARHVLTEQARVLQVVGHLEGGDLERVGRLLVEGHESLRDDFEVSSPELDTAVASALAAGAMGARLTGAGFGGSALVLIATDAVEELYAALAGSFRARGFREPVCSTVEPSQGALRQW